MRVYLAGKIKGSEEWRDRFVPRWSRTITRIEDLSGEEPGYQEGLLVNGQPVAAVRWPLLKRGFLGVADYCGPYGIVSGQHNGSKHGISWFGASLSESSHGQVYDDWRRAFIPGHQRSIARRCLRAIDRSDVVVVVATEHSPGTLCEIGYAVARGKPVIACARGEALDWFPASLCFRFDVFNDSPRFWDEVAAWLEDSHNGLYAQLRFLPHEVYYRSRWWRSRRKRALARVQGKCQFCSATTGLQVHHNTYANLYREPHADLVVLCDKCHTTADVRRRAQEREAASVPFEVD